MLPKALVVSVLLPVPLSGSAATSGHLSSRMGVIYAVCVNHALPSWLPVQDALAANIANPDKPMPLKRIQPGLLTQIPPRSNIGCGL